MLWGEKKTLEETVKTVEAKKSAKRAKVTFREGSSGQVGKVDQVRHKPCTHCSRSNHGSGQEEKKKLCPAFEKKCDNCDRIRHFKRQCLSKLTISQGEPQRSQRRWRLSPSQQLRWQNCSRSWQQCPRRQANGSIKVPNMLHDQLKWVKQSPPYHHTQSQAGSKRVHPRLSTGWCPPTTSHHEANSHVQDVGSHGLPGLLHWAQPATLLRDKCGGPVVNGHEPKSSQCHWHANTGGSFHLYLRDVQWRQAMGNIRRGKSGISWYIGYQ